MGRHIRSAGNLSFVLGALVYPPIPIFEVGPLSLSLHGLFAGLGFVAGAWLMVREVRARGFDVEKVMSVLTWALVASILGARLFTVPAHLGDPGYGFAEVVSVAGDYSILGGYAGGIIGGGLRMRRLGLSVPLHMDMAAGGLAIGGVVGRIGDLAIVEHLGSPTSFFLGYGLRPGYDVSPQHNVLERICSDPDLALCGPYHHTALYDMIGSAILLAAIFWLASRWRVRHYGQLFSVWVIWYGLQRFLIDFTRLGTARDGLTLPDGTTVATISDSVMGPFTGSQWGALSAAVAGLVLLYLFRKRTPVVSPDSDVAYGAALTAASIEGPGDGSAEPSTTTSSGSAE